MLLCRFCNQERKNENSLRNHERLCNDNPNKQSHPRGTLGKTAWNKGLTSVTDIRVFANREAVRKQRKEHGSNWTGRKHSDETKDLMSVLACERLAKH